MGNVEQSHNDAMFGVIMLMSGMPQDSVFMHYYDRLGAPSEERSDPGVEGPGTGPSGG